MMRCSARSHHRVQRVHSRAKKHTARHKSGRAMRAQYSTFMRTEAAQGASTANLASSSRSSYFGGSSMNGVSTLRSLGL